MTSNQDKLRAHKSAHGLTSQNIATMLDVSKRTVDSWLLHSDSPEHRPMKDRDIRFLECLLKLRDK